MLARIYSLLTGLITLTSLAIADDGRAPSIPGSPVARAVSADQIELTWQASTDADGIGGYNVYRNQQYHATTAAPYFLDQAVQANTQYEYWIVAFDRTQRFSSTSRWVYARTPASDTVSAPLTEPDTTTSEAALSVPADPLPPLNPLPPIQLTAGWMSNGSVELSWAANPAGAAAEGYNIYRNNTYIDTTHGTAYIDAQPASADAAHYSVVAFTASKRFSVHSDTVAASVIASAEQPTSAPVSTASNTSGTPATPAGLYTSAHTGNGLTLHWTPATGAQGYNVYRDQQYVTTVFGESWADQGLAANQTYQYSVVAFADQRFSPHSDSISVSTDATQNDREHDAGNGEPARSSATNNAISSEYTLAFSDEFNSGSLDFNQWNTAYLWGPDVTTNNESQFYVDIANQPDFGYQPFIGNGEYLSIKADRTPDWLRDRANSKPYLSGVMTSYDSFQFTYGYAEARLRAPKGNGNFAAFWLLNAKYVELEPEIDITELLGENPYIVHHTYHYYDEYDNLVTSAPASTWVDDFSRDFHTYAVRWSPNEIVWYVDGIETHRLAHDRIAAQPMYVLFNLAIDGDWPVSPDSSTVFPSTLDIDYVRVYRRQ